MHDEPIIIQMKRAWGALPIWLKFLGYVFFIWGSVRAIPILAVLATMLVYIVAIIFLVVCLCACDETVEALNRFQASAREFMTEGQQE